MTMTKSETLRLQSHLRRVKRDYAKAERALIKAALVGCIGRNAKGDPADSGRVVDLTQEVANLRYARNEITMIERELRRKRG